MKGWIIDLRRQLCKGPVEYKNPTRTTLARIRRMSKHGYATVEAKSDLAGNVFFRLTQPRPGRLT